jgi:UDP-N-acetylglucosamine 3-dehydrogenase
MTTNLRVGLIGLGVMGKNHARVLNNLPGIDFVAAHDPAGDASMSVKKDILLDSIVMFREKNLDYCVVAVPTVFHEEVVLEVVRMGVNVFIEKPIAHNVSSALCVQSALKSAKLRGAIGQIERYNPALVKARKLIEENLLGKVYEIFTRRQGWFPARISDVGVVMDLATHDIDLSSWILNRKYQKIAAFAGYQSNNENEDIVSITGIMSGGVVANHIIDWLSPNKIRETRILGEKGCLIADTLNCTLEFHPNNLYDSNQFRGVLDGDITTFKLDKQEPLVLEHEAFRDYILGKSDNVASIDSGIEVLTVCEAILESAKTGNSVTLMSVR